MTEPALTPEEWSSGRAVDGRKNGLMLQRSQNLPDVLTLIANGKIGGLFGRPAAAIALGNAALEDGDSRKLTIEHVRLLRQLRDVLRSSMDGISNQPAALKIDALADAIQCYLPQGKVDDR